MRVYVEPGCTGITAPRDGDAGYDLYAKQGQIVCWDEASAVPTGAVVEIPEGYVGLIRDRSSMARVGYFTHGGVIDSSYRGEIIVLMTRNVKASPRIEAGQKIAQLILVAIITQPLEVVGSPVELKPTERGTDGFGSTDRNRISIRTASQRSGVSGAIIRRAVTTGQLSAIMRESVYLIDEVSFMRWLARRSHDDSARRPKPGANASCHSVDDNE